MAATAGDEDTLPGNCEIKTTSEGKENISRTITHHKLVDIQGLAFNKERECVPLK